MSIYSFNLSMIGGRICAVLLIGALLMPGAPLNVAIAQTPDDGSDESTATSTDDGTGTTTDENTEDGSDGQTGTTTDDGTDDETGTSTDDGTSTSTDDGTSTSTDDGTSTSTDDGTGTTTDDGTGTSSDDGTASSTGDGTDGTDGGTETDGESGTTTSTSTPENGDGSTGSDGSSGEDGNASTTPDASLEDDGEPVPVFSENEVGDDETQEDEEDITGVQYQEGSNAWIKTGPASAQSELFSDVNSNDVKSYIDEENFTGDFDVYTFNATGTNDATVENVGQAFALTGENEAYARNTAEIETGEAVAALNIANVVNSSVVNSDGYLYLKNKILEANEALDMRDLFFPDPEGTLAGAGDCDLLTCVAEDVVYNYSQTNHATITNDAHIEATTGVNYADGEYATITTGDARAGANVINVVNSNIVDSNYRLMTFNALGDLDGDLMLPQAELFEAFFSRPNGISRVEHEEGPDDVVINADNDNDADIDNALDAYAETGLNSAFTTLDSNISTGRGESESNILNKVNENTYGGDSMYILIRIHGSWNGEVRGLPEGLAWEPIPDGTGIVIYNEDAEIAPSEILPHDADTFTANFTNFNRVAIENNLRIDAVTGENEITGTYGDITTGNAFASANVMNIANTNVIGTNWTFAAINIFGDFDGNVTFTEADLALEGEVNAADDPLAPGSELTYTYTVTNNGGIDATGVTIEQTLNNAYAAGTSNAQTASLGTIAPGGSKTVELSATVAPDLAVGTHTVLAVARAEANEGDGDLSDNAVQHTKTVVYSGTTSDDGSGTSTDDETGTSTDETGTSTDDGTGTTTDDGTGTSTDDGTGDSDTDTDNATTDSKPKPSGGGGCNSCGGGGNSTETKSVDREKKPIDPDAPSMLVIEKVADHEEGDVIAAGTPVDYAITVTNNGGTAYDAVLYDTLENPIGAVLSEETWDLGTILPGEEIKVSYTTEYNVQTPSGTYTNRAYVEAYKKEDSKESGEDPLRLDEAKHVIEIDGVPLAIGNVEPVAYFPDNRGGTGALLSWETNAPATGQVFYSPSSYNSVYNPSLPNNGFSNASVVFPDPKTKHYMILLGLTEGQTYTYRIRVTDGEHVAVGGDYRFTLPPVVASLTIPGLTPTVAGSTYTPPAPTSSPAPSPTPAPTTAAAPAPQPKLAAAPEPDPEPEPEPAPAPEPEPEPEPEQSSGGGGVGGFVKKAKDTVLGVFGW